MFGSIFKIVSGITNTDVDVSVSVVAMVNDDKIYNIAKSHFIRGVETKQYQLMFVALLDTYRYCFSSCMTDEVKSAWVQLLSALLLPLMKYSLSLELMYAPNRLYSAPASSSLGSFLAEGNGSYSTAGDSKNASGVGSRSFNRDSNSYCSFTQNANAVVLGYKNFEGLVDNDSFGGFDGENVGRESRKGLLENA